MEKFQLNQAEATEFDQALQNFAKDTIEKYEDEYGKNAV